MSKKPTSGNPRTDPGIGQRLQQCREALGLGLSEAARKIGIAPASLSELEKGFSKQPSGTTLLAMRDAGYNPDYVIRGKGAPIIITDPEGSDAVERNLVEIFRATTDQGPAALLSVAISIPPITAQELRSDSDRVRRMREQMPRLDEREEEDMRAVPGSKDMHRPVLHTVDSDHHSKTPRPRKSRRPTPGKPKIK